MRALTPLMFQVAIRMAGLRLGGKYRAEGAGATFAAARMLFLSSGDAPRGRRREGVMTDEATTTTAKRAGGYFLIFAGCAFVLLVLAGIIIRVGQAIGLADPDRLHRLVSGVGSSAALQSIISVWLLTAAMAVAFPRLWRPFSTTSALLFDVGYGVLGALAGFGLAIGLFGGEWTVLIWSLVFSVVIAVGVYAIRKWAPISALLADGRWRWGLAAVLAIAAPIVLIWS